MHFIFGTCVRFLLLFFLFFGECLENVTYLVVILKKKKENEKEKGKRDIFLIT